MSKKKDKINDILDALESTISLFEYMAESSDFSQDELMLINSISKDLNEMYSNYSLAEMHYRESLKD